MLLLQGKSNQDPSTCREGLRSSRRRASQAVLYNDFVKGELQRLLAQAKARVDAPYEVGYHDERVRYRNWLSSINNDSGAWLKAGVSPKMFEMSNNSLSQPFVGGTLWKIQRFPNTRSLFLGRIH